jgi:hypothetical protein
VLLLPKWNLICKAKKVTGNMTGKTVRPKREQGAMADNQQQQQNLKQRVH